MAVPFDLARLEVSGAPVPIVEGVSGPFGVSNSGSLVHAPGQAGAEPRSLVWVDRKGTAKPLAAPAAKPDKPAPAAKPEEKKEEPAAGAEPGAGEPKADEAEKKPEPEKKPAAPQPLRFDAEDAYLRVRRLTSSRGSEGDLAMTPGGDRIIFAAPADEGPASLVSVEHKGGDRKVIVAGPVSGVGVSLTGDRVAFVKSGGANTAPKSGGKVDTWAIEAQHSAGTSTPTAVITQSGEKLSGKYTGSYGESDLVGSIKGTEFTFTVEIGTEQKVKVVYTGTLSGDTIKGNLTMGEIGEGTFTGKRK